MYVMLLDTVTVVVVAIVVWTHLYAWPVGCRRVGKGVVVAQGGQQCENPD